MRISLDGSAIDVDRVALAGVWNGEYLAIWSAPDALETKFAAGDAVSVDWVRRRLRAEGDNGSDLPVALRAFQARMGLRSDGALNADTVFALSRRDAGPRLRVQEP